MSSERLTHLWSIVRRIPFGRCACYGRLGASLPGAVSGKIVGRWMASAPAELPWWRVIAKTGDLPVGKKDPNAAITQRQLLEQEGVPFLPDGRVDLSACEWVPE